MQQARRAPRVGGERHGPRPVQQRQQQGVSALAPRRFRPKVLLLMPLLLLMIVMLGQLFPFSIVDLVLTAVIIFHTSLLALPVVVSILKFFLVELKQKQARRACSAEVPSKLRKSATAYFCRAHDFTCVIPVYILSVNSFWYDMRVLFSRLLPVFCVCVVNLV